MRNQPAGPGVMVFVLGAALALLPLAGAGAQMTKDQQKCLGALNKGLEKVAGAQGKALAACIKDHAKGKLPPGESLADCVADPDRKGKVQKARDKTASDYTKRCTGTGRKPEGVPRKPDFGVTTPGAISMIGTDKELELVKTLFGSDLSAALVPESVGKDLSKCQQALVKSLAKCEQAKLKEFERCAKSGLKDGAITGAAGLEDCIGQDPKGKIGKACDLGTLGGRTVDRIRKDIDKKCLAKGVDLAAAFPGCGVQDGEQLHECLESGVECQVCLAVNAADDLFRDCDLFDDGLGDGSCPTTFLGLTGRPIGFHPDVWDAAAFCSGGDREGEPCTDTVEHSDCPPKPGPALCIQESRSDITLAVGGPPSPFSLVLPLTGGSSIDCGVVDPQTGVAACQCEITGIEGVDFPLLGFICFETVPGCPPGFIDCDGGTPADAELVADHAIGKCGLGDDPNDPGPSTANAECEALCEDYCAHDLPGDFELFVSSCEGYCRGGDHADRRCLNDSQCPGGSCAGGEPVAHANECQCQCLEVGGNPSRPHGHYCMTGLNIIVEQDEPCDGLDINTIVGERCGTTTTERAEARILNANDFLGVTISGGERTGNPTNCNSLAGGDASGSVTVGHRIFIDSTRGDQETASRNVHLLPGP